jgi:hypothetical protein
VALIGDDDLTRLLAACDGRHFGDKRDTAMIRLLISTGNAGRRANRHARSRSRPRRAVGLRRAGLPGRRQPLHDGPAVVGTVELSEQTGGRNFIRSKRAMWP